MNSEVQLNVKAKVEYDQMAKHQKDVDEFNNLGSKDVGLKDIMQILAPLVLLLLAGQFLEIDSNAYKVMYVIIIVSAFVQVKVSAESKKVNRRIDLLLKILKQDRNEGNN